MKKALIWILAVILLVGGVIFWQGENIVDMIFYDMDATMDLPKNLYE